MCLCSMQVDDATGFGLGTCNVGVVVLGLVRRRFGLIVGSAVFGAVVLGVVVFGAGVLKAAGFRVAVFE